MSLKRVEKIESESKTEPVRFRGIFGWWRLGILIFALFVALLLVLRLLG